MANDNHFFPFHVIMELCLNKIIITTFLKLGNRRSTSVFELSLPDDDSVYTLKKVMEELDFSGLLACYSDKGSISRRSRSYTRNWKNEADALWNTRIVLKTWGQTGTAILKRIWKQRSCR